jgi:phosphopentomutase
MKEDDVLIITADHGCDPGDTSTDHTREYVPFIMHGKEIPHKNLGTIDGFTFVADTIKKLLIG